MAQDITYQVERETREAAEREAEAWRVAQITATIMSGFYATSDGGSWAIKDAVKEACEILAESRRAVSASTTEDSRG